MRLNGRNVRPEELTSTSWCPLISVRRPYPELRYACREAAGNVSKRIGGKEKQYVPSRDSSPRNDYFQFPKASVPALRFLVAGVRERSVAVNPASYDNFEDRRAPSPGAPGYCLQDCGLMHFTRAEGSRLQCLIRALQSAS